MKIKNLKDRTRWIYINLSPQKNRIKALLLGTDLKQYVSWIRKNKEIYENLDLKGFEIAENGNEIRIWNSNGIEITSEGDLENKEVT